MCSLVLLLRRSHLKYDIGLSLSVCHVVLFIHLLFDTTWRRGVTPVPGRHTRAGSLNDLYDGVGSGSLKLRRKIVEVY